MDKKKKNWKTVKNITFGIMIGLIIGSSGVTAATILFDSSEVSYDNTTSGAASNTVKGAIDELYGLVPRPIENGTAIYFNPVTGKTCSDYTVSQSTGTARTGCLKWYIFNDEEGKDTVDMILDHNTTYKDLWNSSGSNASGPSTASGQVLGDLKANTDGWTGVPTRNDYYVDPSKKYLIDYTGYRARLIEANEVWEITSSTNGASNWNSGNTSSSFFYFEESELSGQGTSNYPWLYDYTNNCTSYGCNIANSNTWGYWTSSAIASNSMHAWIVGYSGSLAYYHVGNNLVGVRPVITISKSKL